MDRFFDAKVFPHCVPTVHQLLGDAARQLVGLPPTCRGPKLPCFSPSSWGLVDWRGDAYGLYSIKNNNYKQGIYL